jgi:hypothetical protein
LNFNLLHLFKILVAFYWHSLYPFVATPFLYIFRHFSILSNSSGSTTCSSSKGSLSMQLRIVRTILVFGKVSSGIYSSQKASSLSPSLSMKEQQTSDLCKAMSIVFRSFNLSNAGFLFLFDYRSFSQASLIWFMRSRTKLSYFSMSSISTDPSLFFLFGFFSETSSISFGLKSSVR